MKVKKIGNEIREKTKYGGAYNCHTWKEDNLYEIYEAENGDIYERRIDNIHLLDEEDQEDWIKGMCTT